MAKAISPRFLPKFQHRKLNKKHINIITIKARTIKTKISKFLSRTYKHQPVVIYLRKLVRKFISDGCFIFSSSIAYYFIFSIFPMMLILISISGTLINTLSVKTVILAFVEERLPGGYDFTQFNIEKIIENSKNK